MGQDSLKQAPVGAVYESRKAEVMIAGLELGYFVKCEVRRQISILLDVLKISDIEIMSTWHGVYTKVYRWYGSCNVPNLSDLILKQLYYGCVCPLLTNVGVIDPRRSADRTAHPRVTRRWMHKV